ncbi:MAG: amidohydrolase [Crocinitomicaceae bacterium]
MDNQEIKIQAKAILEEIIAIRRHIHEYPELSFQETKTALFVEKKLQEFGIKTVRCTPTGIVAVISPENTHEKMECIALRADLDALPIKENTGLPYSSKNEGVMHACGHDVHTATLLGVAKLVQQNRNKLTKIVKFIFQPGEELLPGGASLMIKEGVLNNPKVDRIIALHVFPELEVGKVGFKSGMYMASTDELHVTIQGKGGHAAMPHQVIDPIVIASSIVLNLQQIVSRKCDPKIPCVLSFGHFEGIGATNVIPDAVHLKGTFRTMDEAWRNEAHLLIKKQIEEMSIAMGGKAIVDIRKGYPFLVNDEQITESAREIAKKLIGADNVVELPIRMTAEDFSYYSQEVPACFFRLGVRNESIKAIYGVHNSQFAVDEEAMLTGMMVLLGIVF